MSEQSLPDGTYCICPKHDLLMPYRHVHWEWEQEEGCPVLVGPEEERCGEPVQVTTRSKIIDQAKREERERLLTRDDVERLGGIAGELEHLPAEIRRHFDQDGRDARFLRFLQQRFLAALDSEADRD